MRIAGLCLRLIKRTRATGRLPFPWLPAVMTGFVLQGCNLLQAQPVKSFTCKAPVHAVAVSPDRKALVGGCMDGTIKIWNVSTGQEIRSFSTQPLESTASAIRADTKVLASNGSDHAIRLWNLETGNLMLTLKGHTAPLAAIAFSSDGKRLASVDRNLKGNVWDVAKGKIVRSFLGYHVAFSPNGQLLAMAGEPKVVNSSPAVEFTPTLTVWNFETGKKLHTIATDHPDMIYSLAFSRDGKTLATGSTDVTLWDVATGKKLSTFSAGQSTGVSNRIALSPDGKTIARGSNEGVIRIWDVGTKQLLHTFSNPPLTDPNNHDGFPSPATIYGLIFAPEADSVISGASDGVIRIWPLNPSKPI